MLVVGAGTVSSEWELFLLSCLGFGWDKSQGSKWVGRKEIVVLT